MKKHTSLVFLTLFSVFVYAAGNPEFVKFPENYKDSFTLYHTQNRSNNTQVANMYANKIAIDSGKKGELADGSIVVMEVYKPEIDETGVPVTGSDGLFKKSKLAAIGVMEKRTIWDTQFSAEDRTGNWGFAFYDAKGERKENNLPCVSCHTPLKNQDYLFSFHHLVKE